MEEEVSMSPEQKQELNRLKKDSPTIEEVYAAIERLQLGTGQGIDKDRDAVFRYFYPLSLAKAWAFFPNQEDFDNDELARDAAVDNMERWMLDIFKYDQGIAKLSPYFNAVTQGNFKNFLESYTRKNVQVFYGYEEEWTDDITGEEHPPTHTASETYNDVYDYPYKGIDSDDPESLLIRSDELDLQEERVMQIRDDLFPGDREVFDLLLESYNSDEIADILGRTVVAIENSFRRIREATKNTG